MIKRLFEVIGNALAAVWENEVVRAIAKFFLSSLAVICMVALAIMALIGWVYTFLLIIRG